MNYAEFKILNDKLKNNFKTPTSVYHIDKVSFKENKVLISCMQSMTLGIDELVENILARKLCVSNPSLLSNWSGFSEYEKSDTQYLCEITKNIPYTGNFTKNLPYPMLVVAMDKLKSPSLPLKTARDYDCYNFSISQEDLKQCVKQNNKKFKKLSYVTEPVYTLSNEEFKTMLTHLFVLGVLRTEQKSLLSYGRIKLVERPEYGSNIGKCCYSVEFTDDSNKIITLSSQCRIKSSQHIDDFEYIIKTLIKNQLLPLVEKEVKRILATKLNNPVADLFNYKVCNENSVIISLKEDKTPLDLLAVDGFTQGHKLFKIEHNGYSGRMAFIKDINDPSTYFTITWGNSTSMVSDHYWVMRDTLIRCVKQKCLMFF